MTFKTKRKLKNILRVLFILSVFAIFTGLAVVIIIIAQGGKISPKGISKTGIIHLNIQPDKDVKVYVNDKLVSAKNGKIEGLEDGTYKVKLEKEKYTSWTKEVDVEEGIVTEIYATLFPQDLKLEQLTATNIDKIFFSPDGSYVVYTVRSNGTNVNTSAANSSGVWKLKLTQSTFGLIENKPEKIYAIDSTLKDILAAEYNIQIAPDNQHFVISTDKTQLIYSMNGNSNPISLLDVTSIGFLADKISWFDQGNSLIVEKNKTIYEYNLSNNTAQYIYSFTSTPLYTVNGKTLIFSANSKYYLYSRSEKKTLVHDNAINLPIADKLWLSPNSDEILYVKSGSFLYFVDLKRTSKLIGEYDIVNLSPNGNNALILDKKGKLSIFRSEYIAAKDTIKTSAKLIDEKYDASRTSYIWSPDSLQLIKKADNTITMIDKYGENMHNVLASEQIIGNYYYLANNSSDLAVLMKDSSASSNGSNLYRIRLVE